MGVLDWGDKIGFSDLYQLEIDRINYGLLFDRVETGTRQMYDDRIVGGVYKSMNEISDELLLHIINEDVDTVNETEHTKIMAEHEVLRKNIISRTIPSTFSEIPMTLMVDYKNHIIELRKHNQLTRMYTIIFSLKYHKR